MGNRLSRTVAADEVEPTLADIETYRFDFHDDVLRTE
jgi:hypothetical protein